MVKTSDHKVSGAEAQGSPEQHAQRVAVQRKRSIAIGVSLALLVVLFYIATLIKMSDGFVEKAGS